MTRLEMDQSMILRAINTVSLFLSNHFFVHLGKVRFWKTLDILEKQYLLPLYLTKSNIEPLAILINLISDFYLKL